MMLVSANVRAEPMTIDYTGKTVSATEMTGKVEDHKGKPVDWEATREPPLGRAPNRSVPYQD